METIYYCVIYKVSDTYRKNFETLVAAQDFHRIMGGSVYECDGLGNITREVSK